MSLLENLADRLVLCPSTDPVDPEERTRQLIPVADGHLEAWSLTVHEQATGPKLIAVKFPGTAGRAERGGPHPCELWPDVASKIWTINPAGYGGSDGQATLARIADDCESIYLFVKERFPEHKLLLVGNSLGCLFALYLAARHQVDGIFLRNPPPLKQLIATRPKYNWWNFGMAGFVANQIPAELDAIANASLSKCPAFFLRSESDTVVPENYQRLIREQYAGPAMDFVIRGAEHHEFVGDDQIDEYKNAIERFGEMILNCIDRQ